MNLTRDFYFSKLYASTLFDEELILGNKYNTNAIKFQYDFLNDDLEFGSVLLDEPLKMPKSLHDDLITNPPIVFFNNPPYAQAGQGMGSTGKSKDEVAKTIVNKIMIEDKVGSAAQQLYAQFLWRILLITKQYNLTNVTIALFSPHLFLTWYQYRAFREIFLKYFEFIGGNFFNASSFADVKDSWGISFTIFKLKTNPNDNIQTEFELNIENIYENKIIKQGVKTLYNVDNKIGANDWVREPIKGIKTNKNTLQLQSALNYRRTNGRGSTTQNSIGYFLNDSNSIYGNSKYVGLFSAPHAHGSGLNVLDSNFERVISLFAARTIIKPNWVNQKDEYIAPKEEHPKYCEWLGDCLILSLFSTKSNQSSLRSILYKNETYNVYNNWFFMDINDIKKLAIDYNNNAIYNDCRTATNTYVYNKIIEYENNNMLSKEAKTVLTSAINAVIETFEYRDKIDSLESDYNLNTWDAGWYQIKLLDKYFKLNKTKVVDMNLANLVEKMIPLVYELRFLL